jgi:hypothetical protein
MNTNAFEEFKSYVDKTLESIKKKVTKDEVELIELMAYTINVKQENISKAAEYIKEYDKKGIKSWNEPRDTLLRMLGETDE